MGEKEEEEGVGERVGEGDGEGDGEEVWLSPASCMFDDCQEATRHMMSGGMIELAKVRAREI